MSDKHTVRLRLTEEEAQGRLAELLDLWLPSWQTS